MDNFLHFLLILGSASLIGAHTHDEIAKCTLSGIYKTRQTILESPNYPSNYTPATCWDYVVRSPYRCPTKFHIQFLDFYLETSKDCENDYLAIGLDNVDDDIDVLCGQVVGIKKYHTPDGVLRLRFFADESPWSTGKGFKLLVTRLSCEKEEILRELTDDDDTITVTAPSGHLNPPQQQIMDLFRNFSGLEQHQVYPLPPLFGLNYPTQLPAPPYPGVGGIYLPTLPVTSQQNYIGTNLQNTLEKPCKDKTQQLPQQQQQTYYPPYVATNPNYLPISRDQYVGTWPASNYLRAMDGFGSNLEACCTSGFQQKRFYLSSPGFPRTIFSNLLPTERRDCEFHLVKHSSNVCRLKVEFKFFDFGQNFQGTGSFEGNIGLPAIASSRNTCTDDYIEIDNQRFCGCRSEYVYNAFWNYQGDKKIRMRMGYSGIPSGGFLLELTQEECSESQFGTSTNSPVAAHPLQNPNNILGSTQGYLNGQHGLSQQQFSGLSQQQFSQNPLQQPSYLGQQISYPGQQQSSYPGQQQSSYPGQLQSSYLGQQQQPLQQIFSTQGITPSLGLQGSNVYQPLPQFGSAFPGYQYNNPYQYNNLQSNPFGVPQLRYARSYVDSQYQQPVTVVETNSTRKEFYYSDENTFNDDPKLAVAMSRSSKGHTRWDHEEVRANANSAKVRRKCTFDMGDILRLQVDVLWLTKPTCYAPQRNWFTNLIG